MSATDPLACVCVPQPTKKKKKLPPDPTCSCRVSVPGKFIPILQHPTLTHLSTSVCGAIDTPKARRMVVELRKAAPLLARSDSPTRAVRVDMRSPPDRRSNRVVGGSGRRHRDPAASSGLGITSMKGALMADIGAPLGDSPELRYPPCRSPPAPLRISR